MNIFKVLWDLALGLLNAVNDAWNWLNTPINLEFELLGFTIDLDFFGINGMSPLAFLGIGLGTLLLLRLIKGVVPGA